MRLSGSVNKALRPSGVELRRVQPGEPMRTYEMKTRPNRRLRHFQHLVGLIEDVPGDVVECGVGAWKTRYMLAALIEHGDTHGGSGRSTPSQDCPLALVRIGRTALLARPEPASTHTARTTCRRAWSNTGSRSRSCGNASPSSTGSGAIRAIDEYYGGDPPGIRGGPIRNRWFLVK